MGEERGILREGDQELNAPEVETTIYKLQSPVTDQQGRAAVISRQHVPQDQVDSVPCGFLEDRNAGIAKDSLEAVCGVWRVDIVYSGDKLDSGEHYSAHEGGGGELYNFEGTDELWETKEFLRERFCLAEKIGVSLLPHSFKEPHLWALLKLCTYFDLSLDIMEHRTSRHHPRVLYMPVRLDRRRQLHGTLFLWYSTLWLISTFIRGSISCINCFCPCCCLWRMICWFRGKRPWWRWVVPIWKLFKYPGIRSLMPHSILTIFEA